MLKARTTAIPAAASRPHIVERPDGFYWQSGADGREYGPFASLREASDDMEYGEAALEVGEPVEQAASEIGIADWLDPDTGDPAEESIPRLNDSRDDY